MIWNDYDSLYCVSSEGHIKNKKRNRMVREYLGKDGYLRVQIHGKTMLIHRIVAASFIPNKKKTLEVNHKDGNKQNNSITNLEWVTRSENLRHAYKIGLKNSKGVRNGRHKLSEKDVEYIRRNYIKGDKAYGAIPLSKTFGVAHQTICAVVSGQNWRTQP